MYYWLLGISLSHACILRLAWSCCYQLCLLMDFGFLIIVSFLSDTTCTYIYVQLYIYIYIYIYNYIIIIHCWLQDLFIVARVLILTVNAARGWYAINISLLWFRHWITYSIFGFFQLETGEQSWVCWSIIVVLYAGVWVKSCEC